MKKYILTVPVVGFLCQLTLDDEKRYKQLISEYQTINTKSKPDFSIILRKSGKNYHFLSAVHKNSVVLNYPIFQKAPPRSFHFNTELAIAYLMQNYEVFFLHGSSFEKSGKAYVFCGPSGAGKSTILQLSHDCNQLGDDTTILKKDGTKWYVYPSPFDKKKITKPINTKIVLEKIFFLRKATKTEISSLTYFEILEKQMAGDFIMSFIKIVKSKNIVFGGTNKRKRILYQTILNLISAIQIELLYFTKTSEFLKLLDGKG